MRIAGSDYCAQCGAEYHWLRPTPAHPDRLYCACQWLARLRYLESADLEELRAGGDDTARRLVLRRMQPVGRAA